MYEFIGTSTLMPQMLASLLIILHSADLAKAGGSVARM